MPGNIAIIVDNLRIGGAQRIAFDQSYMFADLGYTVTLCSLSINEDEKASSFAKIDKNLIIEKKISIVKSLNSTRFSNLKILMYIFKHQFKCEKVICHSLRAASLIFVLKLILRKKCKVSLFLHQMPGFASRKQQFLRLIYSVFCNNLYIFSFQALLDWNLRYKQIRWLFKTPIFLRNGVYLPRLPKTAIEPKNSEILRLVFLGRFIPWKNYDVLLSLSDLDKANFLFKVPSLDKDFRSKAERLLKKRVQFEVGKGLSKFKATGRDIHIYKTTYSNNIKSGESISINCLEMACLGIPSLVSDYSNSWPELFEIGIFLATNFDDPIRLRNDIENLRSADFSKKISQIREIVQISNQLKILRDF